MIADGPGRVSTLCRRRARGRVSPPRRTAFRDARVLSRSTTRLREIRRRCSRPGWMTGATTQVKAFERSARPILPLPATSRRSIRRCSIIGVPVDLKILPWQAARRAGFLARPGRRRASCRAGAAGVPRPPAMMMAPAYLSMSHGVASLFARGEGEVASADVGEDLWKRRC